MKALVLGGTRFIGKALVERLRREGHDTRVMSRAAGADLSGDRRVPADLARAAEGASWDVVYDFLGMDARDAEVAVEALRGRCSRLVHLSTGAVYWVSAASRCPWVEEDGTLPLRDRATCDRAEFDYGVAKREAERVYRESGLPVAIVRAPVVSGPNDHKRRDLYWVRRIVEGRPLVMPDGGSNVFNHVYVDDLVEMLVRLSREPWDPGEAFNAADRVFTTLREYVSWFAEVIGKPATLVDVPRPKIADAGLHDRSFHFADTKNHVLDDRKAERRLGMRFRTPDEWIPPTVRWCLEQAPDPSEDARLLVEARLARAEVPR